MPGRLSLRRRKAKGRVTAPAFPAYSGNLRGAPRGTDEMKLKEP